MAECLDSLGSLTVRNFCKGSVFLQQGKGYQYLLSWAYPPSFCHSHRCDGSVCLRTMAGGHQQLPNLCLSEKHWNSPSLFHAFWFARITLICLLYGQKSHFFLLFPIRLPLWTLNHLSVFQVFPSVFFSTWISYKPYNWLHLTSTAHLLLFLPCVSSSRLSNKLFAKTSLA